MADEHQGAPRRGLQAIPRASGGKGQREDRLRAALQSNIARRKAQASAARQPQDPPRDGPSHDDEEG